MVTPGVPPDTHPLHHVLFVSDHLLRTRNGPKESRDGCDRRLPGRARGPGADALQRVTDIAGRAAPDAVEGRSYGVPALLVNGRPLLGFRVAKHHISIFPFSAEVVAAVADDLDGFSVSKGTIRFTAD